MPILKFPDVDQAGPEGILAIGGDMHPDSLLLAYRQGIFPWPIDEDTLAWFCPEQRAILEFSELHVPRSLARVQRRRPYVLTLDQAFPEVVKHCALVKRPGQGGTWITPELFQSYCDFHRLGHAHSVEAWLDDRLVGGIYGVDADGAFSAESMFYAEPYASKLTLLHLIDYLSAKGLDWIDIQVMTPHMQALGAKLIPRDQFLGRLSRTRARGLELFQKQARRS